MHYVKQTLMLLIVSETSVLRCCCWTHDHDKAVVARIGGQSGHCYPGHWCKWVITRLHGPPVSGGQEGHSAPVRVALGRHRRRVRDLPGAEGLLRGAGVAADGAHPGRAVVDPLPAHLLQAGEQERLPAAVRGHGGPLQGGRGQHLRGRGHQPHVRAGQLR